MSADGTKRVLSSAQQKTSEANQLLAGTSAGLTDTYVPVIGSADYVTPVLTQGATSKIPITEFRVSLTVAGVDPAPTAGILPKDAAAGAPPFPGSRTLGRLDLEPFWPMTVGEHEPEITDPPNGWFVWDDSNGCLFVPRYQGKMNVKLVMPSFEISVINESVFMFVQAAVAPAGPWVNISKLAAELHTKLAAPQEVAYESPERFLHDADEFTEGGGVYYRVIAYRLANAVSVTLTASKPTLTYTLQIIRAY